MLRSLVLKKLNPRFFERFFGTNRKPFNYYLKENKLFGPPLIFNVTNTFSREGLIDKHRKIDKSFKGRIYLQVSFYSIFFYIFI